VAKISETNESSIQLFQKLKFVESEPPNYFKEIQFKRTFFDEISTSGFQEELRYVREVAYD